LFVLSTSILSPDFPNPLLRTCSLSKAGAKVEKDYLLARGVVRFFENISREDKTNEQQCFMASASSKRLQ
jgi:hypothetical protein